MIANAQVVDEGPHHAVFMKPCGMTVVAGRGVPRPTLLDVAIDRFPGAKPVHRLDRVTAGLCVIAKTPFGQQALSEAFRRHLVDKRYLAIVEGAPPWDKLDIDARLARIDDPDARKGPLAHQTVDDVNGIRALTRVRVLARGDGQNGPVALLECRPETGRMHQIRCHVAHVGFPIVGDHDYGASTKYVDDKGIALLALAISFPMPSGGRAFVAGAVPDAFKQALANARVDDRPIATLVEKFKASASSAKPAHASPSKSPHAHKSPHAKPSHGQKRHGSHGQKPSHGSTSAHGQKPSHGSKQTRGGPPSASSAKPGRASGRTDRRRRGR